jgi:hypothetical protein
MYREVYNWSYYTSAVCVLYCYQYFRKFTEKFYSRTLHLYIIKVCYLSTDVQEFCFKRNIKIYIKNAPTCFGLITIIRERTIWTLIKLLFLKQSVRIIS